MSSSDGAARGRRSWPIGRVLVLLGVALAAFLVSRSCQRSYVRVTEDGAVAIAQRVIDFEPTGHAIRLIPEGVPPRRTWVVSFCIGDPKVVSGKLGVVLVDANTGKVKKVRRCR